MYRVTEPWREREPESSFYHEPVGKSKAACPTPHCPNRRELFSFAFSQINRHHERVRRCATATAPSLQKQVTPLTSASPLTAATPRCCNIQKHCNVETEPRLDDSGKEHLRRGICVCTGSSCLRASKKRLFISASSRSRRGRDLEFCRAPAAERETARVRARTSESQREGLKLCRVV